METTATPGGAPASPALDAQHVIEQVRDEAMFLITLDGRITSWNEGVGLILRWPREDFIGQHLAVAFTEEDVRVGVPQAEMSGALLNGRADDNRWMRRRDGERFFALGALTRIDDETGRPVAFLKMLRDDTTRRQAREETARLLSREGQARHFAQGQAAALTAAIEALGDGVLIADAKGIQRCNAAALRLLGAGSQQELAGDPQALVQRFRLRRERDSPQLLQPEEFPLQGALAGRSSALELWATHGESGQPVFMHCRARPVLVEGRVDAAVLVLDDLEERLRLHQQSRDLSHVRTALQERNQELRAVVDGVRDYAIFTVDPQGRVSSWHQGAQLMKGYTAEEAIGMPFAQLFTPEDRQRGRPQMEMDEAAREGEYHGGGHRMRKDGSIFDVDVVLTALKRDDGQLLGYLKLTRDVTQRRQQEREREAMLRTAQAARAEAERISHSKGEFLATISHELRTPLSAILGWANVLERGVVDTETVKHGLSAILRNARVQVQLIDDLLDMNRVETGQLRLELQRTELGGVVAAAIDSALPAASAKGVGLRTVFGTVPDAVMGDPTRLTQVVGNLLSNAIKFTPNGGQVDVTLGRLDGHAQIQVSDTGQGIEPQFIARMFDRFQQQDASTTRRHGGLGIGLAVVRHLVQLHGGSVHAHSAGPGKGATFTVLLPAVVDGSTALRPETAAALPSLGGSPTTPADDAPPAQALRLDGVSVLIVDDEPDVRAVTMQLLQHAGAHVIAAADAEEALQLMRSQRPTVLLSDIGMPLVDGYELLRRVRRLPEQEGGRTPAAALTAYTRPEDRERALAAGYQLHLGKPLAPVALIDAVARLVKEQAAVA